MVRGGGAASDGAPLEHPCRTFGAPGAREHTAGVARHGSRGSSGCLEVPLGDLLAGDGPHRCSARWLPMDNQCHKNKTLKDKIVRHDPTAHGQMPSIKERHEPY